MSITNDTSAASTGTFADPLRGVPQHIRVLLAELHAKSSAEEATLTRADYADAVVDARMRDKFIALDADKCAYMYQLLRATGATTMVEVGTSFGVSTVYLALAATANVEAANVAAGGEMRKAQVIATEHEPTKAALARAHWQACGETVTGAIELREGDLRETLRQNLDTVDFLLLDIWTPLALPALKLVQPHLRHGAVVLADNTVSEAASYKEFLDYVRAPNSGFVDTVLPFKGGLEMLVYVPKV